MLYPSSRNKPSKSIYSYQQTPEMTGEEGFTLLKIGPEEGESLTNWYNSKPDLIRRYYWRSGNEGEWDEYVEKEGILCIKQEYESFANISTKYKEMSLEEVIALQNELERSLPIPDETEQSSLRGAEESSKRETEQSHRRISVRGVGTIVSNLFKVSK
jgi:hypothetical protein